MDSILGLARGFTQSRVLLTGAELDIFTLLAKESMTAQEVAAAKNSKLHGTTILLDALCALGFLIKKDGRYQTESSAASFLSAESPDSILPMVLYSVKLWKSWSQITDIILDNFTPEIKQNGTMANDTTKALVEAMHVVNSRMAPEVVRAINPRTARNLLDVGSGLGTYTLAFLNEVPEMKATLFDLPPVIEMALNRVQSAGMLDRVKFFPGDFYKDELPPGNDIVLLSAIIHQNSLEQNDILYSKIYQAMDFGGRIIVRDHVMSTDKTEPLEGAMFAVNMLASTMGGGTYTFDEIKDGLVKAGFTRISLIQTKGMFSLIEGFKP